MTASQTIDDIVGEWPVLHRVTDLQQTSHFLYLPDTTQLLNDDFINHICDSRPFRIWLCLLSLILTMYAMCELTFG